MTVGARHEARERALGLLYEGEVKGLEPSAILASLPVTPDPFVSESLQGVQARSDEIDKLIAAHSIDWSVERMPVIDRTVLRMATWELLSRADIPTGAVISEAVDLAKSYSTDESGRFVNGVLAAIAGEVRPED